MAPTTATPAQIGKHRWPSAGGIFAELGIVWRTITPNLYYLAFPKDRLVHKLLVYGIFVLETLQAILVAHDAFASFVLGFGDFKALTDMHFAWFTMPVLSGIVAFFVQLFYGFRIITLSKSRVVGAFISLLAVLSLAGALISGIEGFEVGNLTKLTSKLDHIGHGLFDITSGVCDIVIATCMAFYLSRMDNGSIKSTHAVVSRIIRLIVGTGALTAAVALIDISLYYSGAGKGKGWFLTPAVILGRLYSNSMMVIFNSRVDIVGGRGHTESSTADVVLSSSLGPGSTLTDKQHWGTNHTFPLQKQWDGQGSAAYPATLPTESTFTS